MNGTDVVFPHLQTSKALSAASHLVALGLVLAACSGGSSNATDAAGSDGIAHDAETVAPLLDIRSDNAAPQDLAEEAEGVSVADGVAVEADSVALPDVPVDASASQVVGPAGGEIALPGGGQLVIPAGALDKDTEIEVAVVPAPDVPELKVVGLFHSFEPTGLVFKKPALLTVPYDPEQVGALETSVVVAWSDGQGGWELLDAEPNPSEHTVAAEVEHFSEGGPVLPDVSAEVCCVIGDGSDAVAEVMPQTLCSGGGGASAGAPEQCDGICCGFTDKGATIALNRPKVLCADGWKPLAPENCEVVCCLEAQDFKFIWSSKKSQKACTAVGGTIQPETECNDLVCCGGSAMGLPLVGKVPGSLCPAIGQPLLSKDCDPVCCVSPAANGSIAAGKVAAWACKESGGMPAGAPEECDKQVCCALGMAPVPAMMLPKAACDAMGATEALGGCDKICCVTGTPDGLLKAQTIEVAGCDPASVLWVGPEEDCDGLTCCFLPMGLSGGAGLVPTALCQATGSPLDALDCEPVCCVIGDAGNPQTVVTSRWACTASGAETGPASDCENIACCASTVAGLEIAMPLPAEDCMPPSETLEDDECDAVCCVAASEEKGLATTVANTHNCEQKGMVTALPVEECDNTVCCELGGGTMGFFGIVIPASLCATMGSPLDAAECNDICCMATGPDGMPMAVVGSSYKCASIGGTSLGAVQDCDDPVCCGIPDGPVPVAGQLPKTMCKEIGGGELPVDKCQMVCCEAPALGALAAKLPRWTCEGIGGTSVDDLEACEPECCLTEDGKTQQSTLAKCKTSGGTPVPGAYCVLSNPPGCVSDAQCPFGGNPCLAGKCGKDGLCAVVAMDGLACNDDNPCTQDDTCLAGQCSGAVLSCNGPAPGVCQKSSGWCSPFTGKCVYPPAADGTECFDGNLCTVDDACAAGKCVGKSKVCTSTGNSCIGAVGVCDNATGNCQFEALYGTSCDDGNACTEEDGCDADGTCKGTPKVCSKPPDGCFEPLGTCDPGTGDCTYPPKVPCLVPCDPATAVYTGAYVKQTGLVLSANGCGCSMESGAPADAIFRIETLGNVPYAIQASTLPGWQIMETVPPGLSPDQLSIAPVPQNQPISVKLNGWKVGKKVVIHFTATLTSVNEAGVECL